MNNHQSVFSRIMSILLVLSLLVAAFPAALAEDVPAEDAAAALQQYPYAARIPSGKTLYNEKELKTELGTLAGDADVIVKAETETAAEIRCAVTENGTETVRTAWARKSDLAVSEEGSCDESKLKALVFTQPAPAGEPAQAAPAA